MNASRLVSTLCILFLLASAGPVKAAQSYDNCTGFIDSVPATISTQGVWCLRADLSTAISTGNTIVVSANNVTIDCNDFKLGGLAAGPASLARGIQSSQLNTTVRNCNIRGFFRGVLLEGGGGHVVESNRFDANLYYGIYVFAPGSMVRNNQVFDTGGSTLGPDTAYGIAAGIGTDVIGNTVTNVSASDATTITYGIYTNQNGTGTVAENRIRGVVSNGAGGQAYGIRNQNSGWLIVRNNDIQAQNAAGTVAITCASSIATAARNIITGFVTGITGCSNVQNIINGS